MPHDLSRPSGISPEMLAGYRATEYWVDAEPKPFCLHVSKYSAELRRLLDETGCRCAAFISAFNPFSRPMPDEINEQAHIRLRRTLERHARLCIEGVGQDPSGRWPGEKSLLALGIDLPLASAIGREFRQNAILWSGHDAVPGLVILDPPAPRRSTDS